MIKFLLPIAINVINKAVDKIPEDLDDLIKKFVVSLLKKASSKTCLLYTSDAADEV